MLAAPAGNVGGYFVARRIGAGAMCVVDAAYQPGPVGGRLVALKRLASAFSSDPAARRLFLREASILTRLEHPNVVRTYEVGDTNGEAFIAMELLEGATVSQLQRASIERIPLAIALRIVRDALRGLHAAHELCGLGGAALGLVHQDISPQNIHVAYEGTTRVLDFGVARLAAVDASRTDSIRGKPCYLAPEQLNLGPIDRRADLFAMGIVLHELLTGTFLFPRTRADAAYAALLFGNIVPPRATHPDVPQEIDSVVARALQRDVAARFETADEMRRALADAQDRAGIPEIDLPSLGTWVHQVVPPAWTRGEIELDVTTGATRTGAPESVEDAATLPPRRADVGRSREPDGHSVTTIDSLKGEEAPQPKIKSVLALVALVVLIAAALGSALRFPPPVATPQRAIATPDRSLPSPTSTEPPIESYSPDVVVPTPPAASPPPPPVMRPSPATTKVFRPNTRATVAASTAPAPPVAAPSAKAAEPAETHSRKQDLYDQW